MNKLHDIRKFKHNFNDQFFFDNNVWMFLFCPVGNYQKDKKQRAYSSFFESLLVAKRAIYINSLVLSEFCNASLRMDFDMWKDKPENAGKDYKNQFVGSKEFKLTVESVKASLNNILKVVNKSSDDFNAVKLVSIFNDFGSCDWNDSYYMELARLKNWKIVTDDSDFFKHSNAGIDIITANI